VGLELPGGRWRTWMKAVAMMTPEPKYLAMKKAHSGTPTPRCLAAYTGNAAPAEMLERDGMRLNRVLTEKGPN